MTSDKKFNLIFASLAFTFFSGIISLNYLYDPAGIFGANDEFESFIVSNLYKNDSLILNKNIYDDRKMAKVRIKELSEGDDKIIVTGSSRAHLIGNVSLKRQNVLNLSVSGAVFEDHISIAYLATLSKGVKKIILGIDPWIFNDKLNVHSRFVFKKDFAFAKSKLNSGLSLEDNNLFAHLEKYSQLLNYSYTKESLRKYKFIKNLKNDNQFNNKLNSDGLPNNGYVWIRRDGTRIYNYTHYKETLADLMNDATLQMKPYSFALHNFELLNNLIDFLQEKNIEVIIFLPPYRSDVYGLVKTHNSEILNIEKKIRQMAQMQGVRVFGSYDFSVARCADGDFLDAMHPSSDCIVAIFQEF